MSPVVQTVPLFLEVLPIELPSWLPSGGPVVSPPAPPNPQHPHGATQYLNWDKNTSLGCVPQQLKGFEWSAAVPRSAWPGLSSSSATWEEGLRRREEGLGEEEGRKKRLLEGETQQGDEASAAEADICAQTDRVPPIRSLSVSLWEINNLPEPRAGGSAPLRKWCWGPDCQPLRSETQGEEGGGGQGAAGLPAGDGPQGPTPQMSRERKVWALA